MSDDLSRREFFRFGALAAAAGVSMMQVGQNAAAEVAADGIEEATIADLQAAMNSGRLTALQIVNRYVARIESVDNRLKSIIEVNPDARAIARALDEERQAGGTRGPLHGIPVVLKDNIDTADRMQTAAGSLALVGSPPSQDATVAKKLREAGAVILGKANLSEWANFRSFHSSSGWSGRDGQCKNPYALSRNPCGSSSGSAAAVSANLVTVSLGTETDGSIVCPSSICGVVGIKPTVGLVSRAGVVPIAHSQDTVGPHGRTVADAAAVLGALTGVDPRDRATENSAGKFHKDYTRFLNPDGLRGARIGVARFYTGYSEETDGVFEEALAAMSNAGAVLIDPAEIPTDEEMASDLAELIVLIFEFKQDLNAYLATRSGVPIGSLADAIEFNNSHKNQEMKYFLQEWFELAEAEIFSETDYRDALKRSHRLSRGQGIDRLLKSKQLDAIVAPTGSPAWPIDLINGDHFLGASSSPAAMAGYPLINVPAGFAFGLPVGISFMGTAFSEPTLIKLASGFEAVTKIRRPPALLATPPLEVKAPKRSESKKISDKTFLRRAKRAPLNPLLKFRGLL